MESLLTLLDVLLQKIFYEVCGPFNMNEVMYLAKGPINLLRTHALSTTLRSAQLRSGQGLINKEPFGSGLDSARAVLISLLS